MLPSLLAAHVRRGWIGEPWSPVRTRCSSSMGSDPLVPAQDALIAHLMHACGGWERDTLALRRFPLLRPLLGGCGVRLLPLNLALAMAWHGHLQNATPHTRPPPRGCHEHRSAGNSPAEKAPLANWHARPCGWRTGWSRGTDGCQVISDVSWCQFF